MNGAHYATVQFQSQEWSGVEWKGFLMEWNDDDNDDDDYDKGKIHHIRYNTFYVEKRDSSPKCICVCVCVTDRRNSAEEESKAKQINMKCLYFGRLFVCLYVCVHLCWAGICVRCHIGLSHQALSTNSYSMQFCCVSGLYSSFCLSLSSPFCSVCFSPIDVSVPRLMKATHFRQCLL